MENDIKRRCYFLSLRVVRFLKAQSWDGFSMIVVKQLMRSAVSIGANVIEAKSSSSRLEFKRFYDIALKSANESKYWVCLLRDGFDQSTDELQMILKEIDEIAKILATSILKLKGLK